MTHDKSYLDDVFAGMQRTYEHYDSSFDRPIIGEEKVLHDELMQVHHLAQSLIAHNFKLPFSKVMLRRELHPRANAIGLNLLNVLERMDYLHGGNINEFIYKHKANCPHVAVTLEILSKSLSTKKVQNSHGTLVKPLPIRPEEFKLLVGPEVEAAVDALNELVLMIRDELLSEDTKKAVKSFRRNSTERYKQAMRVSEQRWRIHSKILLIRLDWGFRKKYPAVRMCFKTQKEFEDVMFRVDVHRLEMLKILRAMFGKHLAFYVWKIECGEIKGIHIHWFIGLNGSKYQDRINVARSIANQWDLKVGCGTSYTFNVNALAGAENSGLRVVDYSEAELYEILGRYCDYLTKVDYIVKLRVPVGMRTFGCSKLMKFEPVKRGPKRKFEIVGRDVLEVRGAKVRYEKNGDKK